MKNVINSYNAGDRVSYLNKKHIKYLSIISCWSLEVCYHLLKTINLKSFINSYNDGDKVDQSTVQEIY